MVSGGSISHPVDFGLMQSVCAHSKGHAWQYAAPVENFSRPTSARTAAARKRRWVRLKTRSTNFFIHRLVDLGRRHRASRERLVSAKCLLSFERARSALSNDPYRFSLRPTALALRPLENDAFRQKWTHLSSRRLTAAVRWPSRVVEYSPVPVRQFSRPVS